MDKEHRLSYVTNSGEGEGLLFYGNIIIPFKDRFDRNTKLYGPEDGNAQGFSGLLADGLREGVSIGGMQSRYEKPFTEPPRPYTEDICCERRLWIAQTKERSSA